MHIRYCDGMHTSACMSKALIGDVRVVTCGYKCRKTSRNQPALRIEIPPTWDSDTPVYVQVYVKRGAPTYDFTVVAFQDRTTTSNWRWWFAGMVSLAIVACLVRCWIWQRQVRAVRVAGPHDVPLRVLEEVTTAKEAPTQLQRVGDNLYRRLADPQQTLLRVCEGPAASPGAGSVGGDHPISGEARVQGDLVFEAGAMQEVMGATPAPLVGLQETGDDMMRGGGAQEDREEEETCCVCLDAPREAIFLECGHGGVCVPCAQALWTRTPHSRHCPICREIFTGIVRITEHAGDTIAVETVEYAYAADGANRPLLYAAPTAGFSGPVPLASAAAAMPVRHGDLSFISIVQLQTGLLRSSHRGGQPPPQPPPPPISSAPALLPTASSERTRGVVIDASSGHHLPTQTMQGR